MIRLVIFDLDGTLIESMEEYAELAADLIRQHYGWPAEKAKKEYLRTSGLPFRDQLEILFPGSPLNPKIAEKFEKNWSEFFWEYMDKNHLIDNPFMNFIKFITEMRSYENGKSYENVNVNSFNDLREFHRSKDNFSFFGKMFR